MRCGREKVSGVRFQVSARLLAAKAASQIEKETLKKRIPACYAYALD